MENVRNNNEKTMRGIYDRKRTATTKNKDNFKMVEAVAFFWSLYITTPRDINNITAMVQTHIHVSINCVIGSKIIFIIKLEVNVTLTHQMTSCRENRKVSKELQQKGKGQRGRFS